MRQRSPRSCSSRRISARDPHEDAELIVVDKPAGMHVHPIGPYRTGTLLNGLLWHAGARPDQPWAAWRPSPLHRLDRAASGLVAIAKTAAGARPVRRMFVDHAIADRALIDRAIVQPCTAGSTATPGRSTRRSAAIRMRLPARDRADRSRRPARDHPLDRGLARGRSHRRRPRARDRSHAPDPRAPREHRSPDRRRHALHAGHAVLGGCRTRDLPARQRAQISPPAHRCRNSLQIRRQVSPRDFTVPSHSAARPRAIQVADVVAPVAHVPAAVREAAMAIVIVLQLVGTIASLYLPSLNGDIIDRGVATGDTTYILHRTAASCSRSPRLQIACSIAAVYVGARVAMGYGRDLRGAIFHHVGQLSAREVGKIGAPSLITRTTNDVQQVQMLVLMSVTMFVVAPIMCVGGIVMALREDLALSRLLLVCVPVLAGSIGTDHRPDDPAVPRDAAEDRHGQPRAARADHRHARRPRVRARAREAARFDGANAELTATRARRRPAAGADVPDRDARVQRVERRRAVVRRRSRRRRLARDRRADRVPQLPDADPHVGDDDDVPRHHHPARRRVRRAHRRGARHGAGGVAAVARRSRRSR